MGLTESIRFGGGGYKKVVQYLEEPLSLVYSNRDLDKTGLSWHVPTANIHELYITLYIH